MKKITLIIALGLFLSINLQAQDIVNYPIKAATIEYTMSMFGSESPMTIYFKDKGNTNCTEVRLEMMGTSQHIRSILIGKTAYQLNMDDSTYTERELTDEEIQKSANFFNDETIMKNEGMEKAGTEEFLGKTCQIYTMKKDGADTKIWSWEGLMLKMEATSQGMTMGMAAKSIKEGEPDKMMFEIPSYFSKK